MPKVSRKEAELPLQEVPKDVEMDGEPLPDKPAFAPLSGSEAGQKVEFRRVSAAHPVWSELK